MADDPPLQGDAARALRRLQLALLLFGAAAIIGGPWDMLYHTTNAFDSFLSPPHLFIYGATAASIAVVVAIAASPTSRAAFGRPVRLPGVAVPLPASLVLLGAGLFVVVLSGVLDELWHASFGVDETRWSAPHAMFGWGLFLSALGFVSARLALREAKPVREGEQVLLGILVAALSLYAFLLPFMVYPTRATLDAIASLPVLQSQAGAQHTFRIYRAWGIDHSNPWFVALSALWAGTALAILRGIAPRPRTVLGTVAVASLISWVAWLAFAVRLGTAGDPRAWLPLPILVCAVVPFLTRSPRWTPARVSALQGLVFGALVALVWGPLGVALALSVVAVPGFVGGDVIGRRVFAAIEAPAAATMRWLVPLAGFTLPILCGILDLYLRTATP